MQYRKILATALTITALAPSIFGLGCKNGSKYNEPKQTATATEAPTSTPAPVNWRDYISDRGVVTKEEFFPHTKQSTGVYSFVIRRTDGSEAQYSEKAKDKKDTDPYDLSVLLDIGDEVEIYSLPVDPWTNGSLLAFLNSVGGFEIGDSYRRVYIAKVPK